MNSCPTIAPHERRRGAPTSAGRISRGLRPSLTPEGWGLDALYGRCVEISAGEKSSALTVTMRLIRQAQERKEPVAWIAGRKSTFYPPDASRVGIDLDSLPVVRAERPAPALKAADLLLRSGAFGLVVLDLGGESRFPSSLLPRLAMLAKKHRTALLCLTEKGEERPSLGSLVSLRAQAERSARAKADFRSLVRIVKDKRRSPGWRHEEIFHGPDGLR